MRKGRSCPACRSSLLECGCRSEDSRVLRRRRASSFPCRTSSRSSQSERSVNAFMRCASARFRSHFVWRCAIGLLSGIDVRADGESTLRRGTRLLGNHPVRDLCKGAVWLRGLVIRWQGRGIAAKGSADDGSEHRGVYRGDAGLEWGQKSALRFAFDARTQQVSYGDCVGDAVERAVFARWIRIAEARSQLQGGSSRVVACGNRFERSGRLGGAALR